MISESGYLLWSNLTATASWESLILGLYRRPTEKTIELQSNRHLLAKNFGTHFKKAKTAGVKAHPGSKLSVKALVTGSGYVRTSVESVRSESVSAAGSLAARYSESGHPTLACTSPPRVYTRSSK